MTKLTAVIDGEFEFSKERNSGVYQSDLYASVNARVGNLIKPLSLRKDYQGTIQVRGDYAFSQLTEAGLEIDFEDIKKAYSLEAEKIAKIRATQILDKRSKAYDTCYVHEFKNMKEPGVTITVCPKDEYVNEFKNTNLNDWSLYRGLVRLEYKGYSVRVKRDTGYTSRSSAYYMYWDKKDRRYTIAKNLVKKFKELVEDKIMAKASQERANDAHNERVQKTIKLIEDTFGNCKHVTDTKYRRYSNTQSVPYRVDQYFVSIGKAGKSLEVIPPRIDQPYNEKGELEFRFKNIPTLTPAKAKAIIEILKA